MGQGRLKVEDSAKNQLLSTTEGEQLFAEGHVGETFLVSLLAEQLGMVAKEASRPATVVSIRFAKPTCLVVARTRGIGVVCATVFGPFPVRDPKVLVPAFHKCSPVSGRPDPD